MFQIMSQSGYPTHVNTAHQTSYYDQQIHQDNTIKVLNGKMQKDQKLKMSVRDKTYHIKRQFHIREIKEKIKLQLFIQQYLKPDICDGSCVLDIGNLSNLSVQHTIQHMDDGLVQQILLRCKKSIASQLCLKILNIICYFNKNTLQRVQDMQIISYLVSNMLNNAKKNNYDYVCMGVQILHKLLPRTCTVRWDEQIADVLLDMIMMNINNHTKVRLLRMLTITIERNYQKQQCQVSTETISERIIKSILMSQQISFSKKNLFKSYLQYLACLIKKYKIKETNSLSYQQILVIFVRFAEWLGQIMHPDLVQSFDNINFIKERVFYWMQYINHQIHTFEQFNYDDMRIIGRLVVNSIKNKSYKNFSICKQIYVKMIGQARVSSQQKIENIQSLVTNITELLESSQLNKLSMVLEFFDIIIYNCLKNGKLDEKNLLLCKFRSIHAFSNIQQINRLKNLLKGFKQLQYKFNKILHQISSISHFSLLEY